MKRVLSSLAVVMVMVVGMSVLSGCWWNKPSADCNVSMSTLSQNQWQAQCEYTFTFKINNPTNDKIRATVYGVVKYSFSLNGGWKPRTEVKTIELEPKSEETVVITLKVAVENAKHPLSDYDHSFKWTAI